MIEGQDRTRRWFLHRAAAAGLGAVGVGHPVSSSAVNSAYGQAGARNGEAKRMRLDSHVHVWGDKTIKQLHEYMATEGVTHFVGMVRELGLVKELRENFGARCIPFHRVTSPLEEFIAPPSDSPLGGFKIHLRLPLMHDRDGDPVVANEKHLGKICEAAGRLGRPLVFHSDADEPEICSLPMLAKLAKQHPKTTIIAAHWGLYTQEYQGTKSEPAKWEPRLRAVVPQALQLLLEVKNLYADTARLGKDFPERSADPEFKVKLLIKEVGSLRPAQRKALCDKIFIGTDFPGFRKADDPTRGYPYQAECMRRIFNDDYDEDRMASNFLRLLPEKFRG
jgi:hypothetical protein